MNKAEFNTLNDIIFGVDDLGLALYWCLGCSLHQIQPLEVKS
jgi:hypothetical protein